MVYWDVELNYDIWWLGSDVPQQQWWELGQDQPEFKYIGCGEDEDGGSVVALSERWRRRGGQLHEWESERQSDRRALGLKVDRTKADWLTQSGQVNNWCGVMMSLLSLTVWDVGSDVKTRPANTCEADRRVITDLPYWSRAWASF